MCRIICPNFFPIRLVSLRCGSSRFFVPLRNQPGLTNVPLGPSFFLFFSIPLCVFFFFSGGGKPTPPPRPRCFLFRPFFFFLPHLCDGRFPVFFSIFTSLFSTTGLFLFFPSGVPHGARPEAWFNVFLFFFPQPLILGSVLFPGRQPPAAHFSVFPFDCLGQERSFCFSFV